MAIVNGFDTKKICAQLQRDPMYEVFHSGDDYYIVDGVTMIRCDYDVIEKLRPILGMKIPDYNTGLTYHVKGGWSKTPYENLHKYFSICQEGHFHCTDYKFTDVINIKQIKYGLHQDNVMVCELANGERVLLNKRYTDMMAPAKKWGWFSEGRDRLNAVHFMNKKNIFEMWILPIRYKDGEFDVLPS